MDYGLSPAAVMEGISAADKAEAAVHLLRVNAQNKPVVKGFGNQRQVNNGHHHMTCYLLSICMVFGTAHIGNIQACILVASYSLEPASLTPAVHLFIGSREAAHSPCLIGSAVYVLRLISFILSSDKQANKQTSRPGGQPASQPLQFNTRIPMDAFFLMSAAAVLYPIRWVTAGHFGLSDWQCYASNYQQD